MKGMLAWAGSTKLCFSFVLWMCVQEVQAQAVEMGSFITVYSQDFNTLPSTAGEYQLGVNAFLPDGWAVHRSIPGNVMMVNNGSSNTGGLYSYGSLNSPDRALGAISAEKVGEFTYNLLLQNVSGRIISELDIVYIAEQWRMGSVNTDVQRLVFSYAIAEYPSSFNLSVGLNTPGWTTVPSMQFNSPVIRNTGNINGNDPDNRREFTYTLPNAIPDGYYVMLRWYDPDELHQDHGLAIDDVRVTWKFEPDYVPLPVELTKFTAEANGRAVKLDWTTASEQDSRHFEIERSTDGRRFKQIGIVDAQGTTSLTTHYTFQDIHPIAGVAYYRLKQVDDDLTYTYSKVVAVTTKPVTTASLYPTVATKEVILEVSQAQATYQITVYDKMGSAVLQQQLGGNIVYTLDVNRLGHGKYVLVLLNEMGERQTLRFLKI